MSRIAYVILCSCLIAIVGVIASPANAGSRDDGYYADIAFPPPRPSRVWYSSSCCYMKVVRHVGGERQVRYVKVKPSQIDKAQKKKARMKHHREHAARRDRERPRERVSRSDRPRDRAEYKIVVVHRDRDRDDQQCQHRRIRVLKPGGGWTWALKAACE